MADRALMGMATVLKPFWYFEYTVENVKGASDGATPILLQPVQALPAFTNPPTPGNALDPDAGNEGYNENLVNLLDMPQIGSDICVYLPMLPAGSDWIADQEDAGTLEEHSYLYVPLWRNRTIRDWRMRRKQGHIRVESVQADDEYVMPASVGGLHFHQNSLDAYATPPGNYVNALHLNQHDQLLRYGVAISNYAPFLPGDGYGGLQAPPISPYIGSGDAGKVSQGIVSLGDWDVLHYYPWWLKVAGDQFGILVYKIKTPRPTDTSIEFVDWDFDYVAATGEINPTTAEDVFFSVFFGVGFSDLPGIRLGLYEQTGAYVLAGKTTG